MNSTKKTIISNYIKILIPELNITKITKKKHNYIINGNILLSRVSETLPELKANGININPYTNEIDHNITELKTYTIPVKDIITMLPTKRKIPKVNKINLS